MSARFGVKFAVGPRFGVGFTVGIGSGVGFGDGICSGVCILLICDKASWNDVWSEIPQLDIGCVVDVEVDVRIADKKLSVWSPSFDVLIGASISFRSLLCYGVLQSTNIE